MFGGVSLSRFVRTKHFRDYFVSSVAAGTAAMAAVGIFSLTGSTRGLASILAFVVMGAARFLGWRAGVTAATVATLAQDFFFMGEPGTIFVGSSPQHFIIYFGFYACAVFAAFDIKWLDRVDLRPSSGCPADRVADAQRGEAEADRLIEAARDKNATYLVVSRMKQMIEAGQWTGYESGFAHALAQHAILSPADNDADWVDPNVRVSATDSNIVTLPISREKVVLKISP